MRVAAKMLLLPDHTMAMAIGFADRIDRGDVSSN
jgi:hypothetical protein